MLCTDTSAVQQIITIKHDESKLLQLNDTTVLALSGKLPLALTRSPCRPALTAACYQGSRVTACSSRSSSRPTCACTSCATTAR